MIELFSKKTASSQGESTIMLKLCDTVSKGTKKGWLAMSVVIVHDHVPVFEDDVVKISISRVSGSNDYTKPLSTQSPDTV